LYQFHLPTYTKAIYNTGMHIYLISEFETRVTSTQKKTLQSLGEVYFITHKGKLTDLAQLSNDTNEKILALSPTAFDWQLDVNDVDAIPNIKAVITQSTSFDWIQPQELKKRNIIACNCPGFSSESVAEFALSMAIDVSRRLPLIIKNNWKENVEAQSMLLKGKTLGIVGMGRIGTEMARVGAGIGMEIVYWSRSNRNAKYTYLTLPQLFKTADVLMPALVENEETKGLITPTLVDTMKPSAIIVGIGRVRDLLPQDYIFDLVAKNKLGGYAIEGHGTKTLTEYQGNVWALPPMAWITLDSRTKLFDIWVENIIHVASGTPQNVIN
jgi:glycerate dehydrogenase